MYSCLSHLAKKVESQINHTNLEVVYSKEQQSNNIHQPASTSVENLASSLAEPLT